MQPGSTNELNYLLAHFGLANNTNTQTTNQFNVFPNPFHQQLNISTPHIIAPQMPTSLSSNSTSDEADEQQLSIINERKQRRMISNRESARRSRMRKQKHLDELWSQVMWLRNENHQLVDKLNHVSESHDRAVQENAQLKEEALELRRMLSDMQISSPFHHDGIRELVDEPVCDDLP
ncbi:hypothetical protein CASFOL_011779 [Castilleja foliolosa]|uniref:BZIP domain-containing protein n=1 Tax=Castilleja foliolosa TaxID=1961234 RepID=A0ABD3DH85_9LAMI